MQEYVIGQGWLENMQVEQKIDVVYGLLLLSRESYNLEGATSSIFAVSIRSLRGEVVTAGWYRLFTQDGKIIEMENTSLGWRVVRATMKPSRLVEAPVTVMYRTPTVQ